MKQKCPVRELRHPHHIHHGRHQQARQGNPDGHIGLAGELVPHGYVEEHPQYHIAEEHYRHHLHAHAEVPPQEEGNDVDLFVSNNNKRLKKEAFIQ